MKRDGWDVSYLLCLYIYIMSTTSFFDTIPDEMILEILKKMHLKELQAAASISSEFFRVIEENPLPLWKSLCSKMGMLPKGTSRMAWAARSIELEVAKGHGVSFELYRSHYQRFQHHVCAKCKSVDKERPFFSGTDPREGYTPMCNECADVVYVCISRSG